MKISIALTTYNGERYIKDLLNSIYNNSRRPDEVIICDDSSSDNTVSIIINFIKQYNLKNWILNINNANLGYRKNFFQAIKKTTGDLIFLADQDDIWNVYKIESLSKVFLDNQEMFVLNSAINLIDGHSNPIYLRRKYFKSNANIINFYCKNNELKRISLNYILKQNISPGCTICFNRFIKEEYLKLHEFTRPHDWCINVLGSLENGLYYYNAPLTEYRLHDNNTIGFTFKKQPSKSRQDSIIKFADELVYLTNTFLGISNNQLLVNLNELFTLRMHFLKYRNLKYYVKMIGKAKTYLQFYSFKSIIVDILFLFRLANHL